MAELTQPQWRALVKLADIHEPISSYAIRERLNVLDALERRNLVTSQRGPGSMAFPSTAIQWAITEAGRRALDQGGKAT